jgi:hypothetical protein
MRKAKKRPTEKEEEGKFSIFWSRKREKKADKYFLVKKIGSN